MLGNAQALRGDGKCHREQTADGAEEMAGELQPSRTHTGKGETAR